MYSTIEVVPYILNAAILYCIYFARFNLIFYLPSVLFKFQVKEEGM